MRNEELFKERPVWNAILTLAIPSVLSILVMLLYNIHRRKTDVTLDSGRAPYSCHTASRSHWN